MFFPWFQLLFSSCWLIKLNCQLSLVLRVLLSSFYFDFLLFIQSQIRFISLHSLTTIIFIMHPLHCYSSPLSFYFSWLGPYSFYSPSSAVFSITPAVFILLIPSKVSLVPIIQTPTLASSLTHSEFFQKWLENSYSSYTIQYVPMVSMGNSTYLYTLSYRNSINSSRRH